MLKEVLVRLSVVAFVCCISVTAHAMADQKIHVNVPAGDLTAGLELLARQSGAEFVYRADQLKGLRTRGVAGDLTPKEAVTELLIGTPLQLRMDPSGAMLITPARASTTSDASSAAGSDSTQEGKSNSSGAFLLAQATPGQASSASTVERQDEQASKKKPQLEEVIVTGSRIPQKANAGAQEVKVYSQEQIKQSGQNNVADFLNTLPDVSLSTTSSGFQTSTFGTGATTVQLHGLPVGSTLVLLNGRRVEQGGFVSASGANVFDLNSIPLIAVERIEIVPSGSSAIYGADAIAGVVNVILKKNFDGLEVGAEYGGASATDEWSSHVAWGKQWSAGSIAVVGSYENQSALLGTERALTANADRVPFGGRDARSTLCNPGNVFTVDGSPLPGAPAGSNDSFAAVSPSASGNPAQTGFQGVYGSLNKCSPTSNFSLIPATERTGILVSGNFEIAPSVEPFFEILYSHSRQSLTQLPVGLSGGPGAPQYTVSAANPFNPFGETVGVSDAFTGVESPAERIKTDFYRALIGTRGDLRGQWKWEVAGWVSQDSDNLTYVNALNGSAAQAALNSSSPATALNPFVAGPAAPTALLQSLLFDEFETFKGKTVAANGFVRGPLLQLPSGPLEIVVGGEYNRSELDEDNTNFIGAPNTDTTFHRTLYAAFSEARVPIVGNHGDPSVGDTLSITAAARYDHYDDFGSKTTPLFGVEWRPLTTLLIRGNYGKAFKAPSLFAVHAAPLSFPDVVADPLRGGQIEPINETFGGNSQLHPETGQSRVLGLVYDSKAIQNLEISITHWSIEEADSVQPLFGQTIVNNESLFPNNVIRAASCAGGPPCPITQVNDTFLNFGSINIKGFDYQISYKVMTKWGQLAPSVTVTETDQYNAALQPGLPGTDRLSKANDDGNWAPRWKGTVALGWTMDALTANVNGRYVGRYQDYDSTNYLGDFWLYDANLRFALGPQFPVGWLTNSFIELGGVNVLNTLPKYSNYDFGFAGYDPATSDIRGRFLYVRVGAKW